ncbi:MAG: hypothetical protein IKM17_01525 [Lentisphaeria bacterium]|nr:hypothetical protein [Lentisphaeria bacterium]
MALASTSFFGHEISRIIAGDNPFNGHSYITDQISGQEMLDYYTSDVWQKTLFDLEAHGFTAMMPLADPFVLRMLGEYKRNGGKMKFIFQPYNAMNQQVSIRQMAALEPIGIYQQGTTTDYLWEQGDLKELHRKIDEYRQLGVPVGLGSHVPEVIKTSSVPTAVEFMEREVILAAEEFLARKFPDNTSDAYLLLTYDGASREEVELAWEDAAEICLKCGALDVFLSNTQERNESIWSARGAFLEAIKASTTEMDECDVVVPRRHVAEFVLFSHALQEKHHIRLRSFGHAGDGNLHIYVLRDELDDAAWQTKLKEVFDDLYEKARALGGKVSGEHGIGYAKRPYLAESLSNEEKQLMVGIKAVFDPENLLNPGKVIG